MTPSHPTLSWRILPGLPGTGPLPEQFSETGLGKHSEGVVVEFTSDDGMRWVGNFQPGGSSAIGVFSERSSPNLIILARGIAYIVDPWTRSLIRTFGANVQDVIDDAERNQLVFGNGLWFEAVGIEGLRWRTRQLALDGMRSVRVEGAYIRGEAYNPFEHDEWHAFEVDLTNGSATGGSYDGPT